MSEKGKSNESRPMSFQQTAAAYLHDIVFMLSGILILFLLVFRVIVVSGASMNMTLLNGDYLILLGNVFYHEPEQGDIVVVSKESFDHGKAIVKRVIATEGQIVDIDFVNGFVYVDGLPLDEPYINTPTNVDEGMQFPLIVDENCVFVMGDNRNRSKDSRSPEIGQVDRREILGRAFFLVFPGVNTDTNTRIFSRIGVIQ